MQGSVKRSAGVSALLAGKADFTECEITEVGTLGRAESDL